MKILKVFRGRNADLAALDEPIYTRDRKFEAHQNGRVLAKLNVVSGGPFPICEVREMDAALSAMDKEGLKEVEVEER